MPHDPDQAVTVARFDQPVLAHLALGRLQNAGIDAIVVNDTVDNLTLYTAVERGIVRLQVRAADREAALEVLEISPTPPASSVEPEDHCPRCDSPRVERRQGAFWLRVLFAYISGGVRSLDHPPRRCLNCGARW